MYNELTKSGTTLRLYKVTDSLPGPGGCMQRPSMVLKKKILLAMRVFETQQMFN